MSLYKDRVDLLPLVFRTSSATLSMDFLTEVAKNNVPGHSLIHKFGRNPDIDTAAGFEVLWNGGGPYTGFDPTGAEVLSLVSSDANDTLAGTGAITVELFGLLADYTEDSEVVILDGVTPVDTIKTFIRMNRMIVRTAGSGGSNVGELTCIQKTAGHVMAVMPVGYNQTMISAYTIPIDKDAWFLTWFAGLAGKTQAVCNVRLVARPFGETFQVKEEMSVGGAGTSGSLRPYAAPKQRMAAKTDIFIEADTSLNDSAVAGGFDLLLVDD